MDRNNADVMKKMQYILNMRPVLNTEALFSDGSDYYRCPSNPKAGDKVRIRFRTKRNNVDMVYLVYDGKRQQMERVAKSNGFDYYETSIIMGEEIVRYHFEITYGWVTCYYNYQGVSMNPEERLEFEIYPDYDTPQWAKGAVMYQIFVDRFCNGDPTNDVEDREYFYIGDMASRVRDWGKVPAVMGVREFYGGDLQGIMDKLDYLQDLGVDVIYLNPIFVSPSNHKYDIQDYEYVDPHYGKIVEDMDDGLLNEGDRENAHARKFIKRVTDKRNLEASNELFAKLVEEIHKRGMKVILDGVFNHCGSFNKWMDRERIYENQEGYPKGAYISADSPYRYYFNFYDENRWPYNPTYDGWWTHDTLPKLNYEASRDLYDKILEIGKKWVSAPYNVDGWRLDVAADLGHTPEYNHKFWKGFREAVKRENPEAIILAEHYGDPSTWLDGTQWDTVMNYDAFMEPISWFLTGMEKHSDARRNDLRGNASAFFGSMTDYGARFTTPSALVAMNELSNHDHSRFLTRTNHVVGRTAFAGPQAANYGVNLAVMRQAVLMQMTWVGAPTIYYGDEAGVCGWTDPDNRRSYPWGKEDHELIRFHKEMIRIHKDYEVFSTGSLLYLHAENNLIGYGRFNEKEQAFVLVQVEGEEREVEVDVWRLGVANGCRMACMMYTCQEGFDMAARMCRVENGKVKVEIGKNGAVLWKTLSM